MKCDQLIEYNMRNMLIQKSSKNVKEKLVSDLFLENQKIERISVLAA